MDNDERASLHFLIDLGVALSIAGLSRVGLMQTKSRAASSSSRSVTVGALGRYLGDGQQAEFERSTYGVKSASS